MEFKLLGPVEAWVGARRLSLGGPKPVALLAVLLLHRGHVVPVERIIDLVWDDHPPATVRAVVASHVAALRREFGPAGHSVILTRSPGYIIEVASAQIDAVDFERAVALARGAVVAGGHREAAERLTAALGLWRGERALEGIGLPFAEAEAARLDELRLVAVETRFASLLALGDEVGVVAELFATVAAHPLRERLRGQLMTALYRIGRQADALRVYQEGRDLLADELGLDPGPELRAVRQAVLTDDVSLLSGAPTMRFRRPRSESADAATRRDSPAELGSTDNHGRSPEHAFRIPGQLPPDIVDFTGREWQAVWIRRLTEDAAAESGRTALPIGVISGRAGSGKTALAVRMGHELASRFPDGQLFMNLQAETRPIEPAEALERLLRALGVEAAMIPTGLDQRVELYRMLLSGRRVLVILDNAAGARQVRPMLPGAATCAVIVTSRARLASLEGAASLDLDVLDEPEAVSLFARIAGADRVGREERTAAEVVRLCGRLPLAVRIAGARLAARPDWTVERLAARLRGEHGRLDELTVGDLEIRASLGLSYVGLTGRGRTAMRRLGLINVPDFASWIIAPLLDTDVGEAEDLVDQLVEARLVDPIAIDATGQTRYGIHDLVRLYVRERAHHEESEADRNAALTRVVSCWLSMLDTAAAGRPSTATRGLLGAAPRWPVREDTVKSLLAQPFAWFTAELASVVAIVEQCADQNLDEAACELASVLIASPFALYNEFDAWSRTHEAALAATRRAGNSKGEAVLLAGLGQLRYEQDRFVESGEYFRDALRLFQASSDARGEAVALAGLGTACWEQADFSRASTLLGQALAAFAALDDPFAIARVQHGLGVVHREQGRYDEAMTRLTSALETYSRNNDTREEAVLLRSISLVHRARGKYDVAAELCALAVEKFSQLDDGHGLAYARQALAKALLRLGRTDDADTALTEALAICHERRDRFGEALVTRTLGELHLVAGDLRRAEEELRAALGQWDVLQMPLWRARTLRDLGRVQDAGGDERAARRTWAEAVAVFRRLGSHEAGESMNLDVAGAPGRLRER